MMVNWCFFKKTWVFVCGSGGKWLLSRDRGIQPHATALPCPASHREAAGAGHSQGELPAFFAPTRGSQGKRFFLFGLEILVWGMNCSAASPHSGGLGEVSVRLMPAGDALPGRGLLEVLGSPQWLASLCPAPGVGPREASFLCRNCSSSKIRGWQPGRGHLAPGPKSHCFQKRLIDEAIKQCYVSLTQQPRLFPRY